MHKTTATADGQVQSDVDELYRLSLGLENPRTYVRDTTGAGAIDLTKGWTADTYRGVARLSAYGAEGGKRAAFVRIPDKHATIIVLTTVIVGLAIMLATAWSYDLFAGIHSDPQHSAPRIMEPSDTPGKS